MPTIGIQMSLVVAMIISTVITTAESAVKC